MGATRAACLDVSAACAGFLFAVEIAQQFAIYEELASLLWLHYAGWEDL